MDDRSAVSTSAAQDEQQPVSTDLKNSSPTESGAVCEVCEVCEGSGEEGTPPTSYCPTCFLHLCPTCSDTHHTARGLRHHALQPLPAAPDQQQQQQPSPPPWTFPSLTCRTHEGQPVTTVCPGHGEMLCDRCGPPSSSSSSCPPACPTRRPLPTAAQLLRARLQARVRTLRDRESAMSAQMDHITNEFTALRMQLEDAFLQLRSALEGRREELAREVRTRESLALGRLATEVTLERDALRAHASSVAKIVDAAPDDALVAMTEALTSRLDDAEGGAPVTSWPSASSAAMGAGRLVGLEGGQLRRLKEEIGAWGRYEGEGDGEIPQSRSELATAVRGNVADKVTRDQGAELARKLRNGHRVRRSGQWKSGNKDGGQGTLGTVLHVGKVSALQGMVKVGWDSGRADWHCMGRERTYELELV